jgi:hypothetical protein
MDEQWNKIEGGPPDRVEQTREYDGLCVTAVKYDTGEWKVWYGTDGEEPTELYKEDLYRNDVVMRQANACMNEIAGGEAQPAN